MVWSKLSFHCELVCDCWNWIQPYPLSYSFVHWRRGRDRWRIEV